MKKYLILLISFTLLVINPIGVHASSLSSIQNKLVSEIEIGSFDDKDIITDYDILVSSIAKCILTNKHDSFLISDDLGDDIMSDSLHFYDDVLSYNAKSYDLKNIVDAMSLTLFTYIENGKMYAGISVNNITYNSDLSLDYEDYYSSIIKSLKLDKLTDYEKVLKINNFICDSFDYDDAYVNGAKDKSPTLQIAFDDRSFICGNYTVLFNDLLNRVGIQSRIVLGWGSNNEPHAFNLVKIGSKWYWSDVTWNDSTESNNFLLVGDKTFKSHHKIAPLFYNSLDSYNISTKDYNGVVETPEISNIRISSKNKLYVDYKLGSASKCSIYLDGKKISNGGKISKKNGSIIKIKFNNSLKTTYSYRICKVSNKYYLLKL